MSGAVAADRVGRVFDADPGPASDPWRIEVLVVDDDPADAHWMTRALQGMQEYEAQLTFAASVSVACDLVSAREFDVALIDYHLPDGHGDEVVDALRRKSSKCAPVMISGHPMGEVSYFALESGAVAAISKDDLNPTLLETTIRFALRNHANARR